MSYLNKLSNKKLNHMEKLTMSHIIVNEVLRYDHKLTRSYICCIILCYTDSKTVFSEKLRHMFNTYSPQSTSI